MVNTVHDPALEQPADGSPADQIDEGRADAVGRRHTVAGDNARIVSLVPSLTELLVDLGLGQQLVGRTGFCIHPRDVVRGIPKVGGTKDVKLDEIRRLNATHVIVNVDENRREDADALIDMGLQVIATHPQTPEDNRALYDGDLSIAINESLSFNFTINYRRDSEPHGDLGNTYIQLKNGLEFIF